jgi:integrase
MRLKLPYLTTSPSGWYEYRRGIPKHLREFFPRTKSGQIKLEWKAALKTKLPTVAQGLWVKENQQYEKFLSAAGYLHDSSISSSTTEAVATAKQMAIKHNVHPEQAPSLDASATDAEINDFSRRVRDWNLLVEEHQGLLASIIHENYIDEEQRAKDYQEGHWGQSGYETPYKPQDPTDPLVAQYAIVTGGIETTASASWADATELYIKTNKRDIKRLPDKAAIWEKKTRQLLSKFGDAMDGPNTKLDDLDRQAVSDWMWKAYPKAGTRNRYNNTFSAVMNTWNREQKGQSMFNPFSGLSNKTQEREEAVSRRSFKPDEWQHYLERIQSCENDALRLIGLLMIYTGCRTSEAAGLQVRDLKLDANLAHVVFRTNELRRMDKDGFERAVPFVGPLIDAFRGYALASDPNAPAFPEYVTAKGHAKASASLRSKVRDEVGILDEAVVPYSARHTLKDRADAAGIPIARAEYIMGHVSEGASKVHKSYGTKTPPTSLLDDMLKIFDVTDWGYYEE